MTDRNARVVARLASDAQNAAIISRYPQLNITVPMSEYRQLIPRPELPPVIATLEAMLLPATQRQVEETIALIGGAWPSAHTKAEPEAMALFVLALREDLAEFPPDVLVETVRKLRRTLTFPPSIGEIYQAALALTDERRSRLDMARQHLAEHDRRDTVAREKAEQAAERRRELEAERVRLVAIYGASAEHLTINDIDLAPRGIALAFNMTKVWRSALDQGEPWALRVLPLAALGAWLMPLYGSWKLQTPQMCEAIALARNDIDAARRFVADAVTAEANCAGAAPKHRHWPQDYDDATSWPHPARYLADVVAEIRREQVSFDEAHVSDP